MGGVAGSLSAGKLVDHLAPRDVRWQLGLALLSVATGFLAATWAAPVYGAIDARGGHALVRRFPWLNGTRHGGGELFQDRSAGRLDQVAGVDQARGDAVIGPWDGEEAITLIPGRRGNGIEDGRPFSGWHQACS